MKGSRDCCKSPDAVEQCATNRTAVRRRGLFSSDDYAILYGRQKISSEYYGAKFPNSIPLDTEVFAWLPEEGCWHSATVQYARHAHIELPVDETRHCTTTQIEAVDNCDFAGVVWRWSGVENYDYYIHFHQRDRRHDNWYDWKLLRPIDFRFEEAEAAKNVKKMLPGFDATHAAMDPEYVRRHMRDTRFKMIGKIHIAGKEENAWYFSPVPQQFQDIRCLFICRWCLEFFRHQCELQRHEQLCSITHPPGSVVYRDRHSRPSLELFEVDGSTEANYAENLCYLTKFYLDHKSLQHPVRLFLFYVLAERTPDGRSSIMGYFSQEKWSSNNVACIFCLRQKPPLGRLLISLSYGLRFLSHNASVGTPERPLSDKGFAAYSKFWAAAALHALLPRVKRKSDGGSDVRGLVDSVCLADVAAAAGVLPRDLAVGLHWIGVLQFKQTEAGAAQDGENGGRGDAHDGGVRGNGRLTPVIVLPLTDDDDDDDGKKELQKLQDFAMPACTNEWQLELSSDRFEQMVAGSAGIDEVVLAVDWRTGVVSSQKNTRKKEKRANLQDFLWEPFETSAAVTTPPTAVATGGAML